MHVGEEVFHSIRMNQLEYNAVVAEIDRLLEDHELDEDDIGMNYPTLHRFFSALGAIRNDTTPIIPDTPLVDDDEDTDLDLVEQPPEEGTTGCQ